MGAEQLQVLDVFAAAPRLRNDVVDLQVAELERRCAPVAPSLLLPEQNVLVLAVMDGRGDVRTMCASYVRIGELNVLGLQSKIERCGQLFQRALTADS